MDGAAGPSGIDAAGWKRQCTSFGKHSTDLCDAISCLARIICTTYVDPKGLEALVACRLIALDMVTLRSSSTLSGQGGWAGAALFTTIRFHRSLPLCSSCYVSTVLCQLLLWAVSAAALSSYLQTSIATASTA